MAIIPEFFLNAVVAIGVELPSHEKAWIGTGFIVGRNEKDNPELRTCYLISNKHVFEKKNSIIVRFNSVGDQPILDYPIRLRDENNNKLYSEHPDEDIDIAAIQLIPQILIKDKSIWGAFNLENNALTLAQMQSTGVMEGSLIYSLGFPMNLVDNIKTPICRLGCISRVSDAFVNKENCKFFLTDVQTFPGNSGGPIIYRPETTTIAGTPTNTSANLIGILSGYITYRDTLVSQQTGRLMMITEENSGLTIVHPVDRIKEVVEIEWNKQNKKLVDAISETSNDELLAEKEA